MKFKPHMLNAYLFLNLLYESYIQCKFNFSLQCMEMKKVIWFTLYIQENWNEQCFDLFF